MPTTTCTHANSDVIKWARTENELTISDAANALRIDEDQYKEIENGNQPPTLSQLRSLAKKFKRPVAIFFLASPPTPLREPTDYRTLVNSKGPKLKLSIRKARKVQKYMRDLGVPIAQEFPRLNTSEPISVATQKIRDYIGVSKQQQFEGSEAKSLFEKIQAKLEQDGISLLLHSFPRDEARAYSFAENPKVIVISTSDDVYGARNFSLLHEFAHLGLRRSGLCIVAERNASNSTERFCDKVAVNFLMPSDAVRNFIEGLSKEELLTDYCLSHISNKLKSSRLALLIRLEELDIIDHQDYLRKKTEWDMRRPSQGGGGGSSVVANTVKENGNPLTKAVTLGYSSGAIDASFASKILNVNQSYIEAVGDRVSER